MQNRDSLRAWAVRKPSLAAVVALVLAHPLCAGPFDGWTRKVALSYDSYTGSEVLTNFPVLVTLSTNLQGFSYHAFESPAGGDLRFSDGLEIGNVRELCLDIFEMLFVYNTKRSLFLSFEIESCLLSHHGPGRGLIDEQAQLVGRGHGPGDLHIDNLSSKDSDDNGQLIDGHELAAHARR